MTNKPTLCQSCQLNHEGKKVREITEANLDSVSLNSDGSMGIAGEIIESREIDHVCTEEFTCLDLVKTYKDGEKAGYARALRKEEVENRQLKEALVAGMKEVKKCNKTSCNLKGNYK